MVVKDFNFNFGNPINWISRRHITLTSPRTVSQSLTPNNTSFNIPSKMRILNGVFYGGMKVGYYNHKYIIHKANGAPLLNKWFGKRPHFFKQPFGKYNTIAHVSCGKSLFAVSIDGRMYDMHKLWSDVYLTRVSPLG